MADDVITPNLKLRKIAADRMNWSETMNSNLATIDATVGAYFTINGLVGIWENSTVYAVNDSAIDEDSAVVYMCLVAHTSSAIPTTFAQERTNNPTRWAVYSSPARFRGTWTSNTAYALNDFVVSGAVYAICILSHTSGSNFTTDLNAGKWAALIDLSSYGVMPEPTGNPNKLSASNGAGTGYALLSADEALGILGYTAFTKTLVTQGSATAFRTAIDAAQTGAFQASNGNLSSISSLTTQPYGLDFLTLSDAGSARTYMGLGSAAVVATGTINGTIPVLGASGFLDTARIDTGTASGKIIIAGASGLPAIAAPLLTDLNGSAIASGTVAKARGGTGQWASAYVTIAAGVLTVVKSSGITSIVRASDGNYTVTMSSAMPDVNYRVQATALNADGATSGVIIVEDTTDARTTTVFKLYALTTGNTTMDSLGFSLDVFE